MGEWTPERQKNLKENIAIGGNYSLGKFRNGHKNINRHGINVIDVHVALTGGDNLYSRQLVEALNEIPDALSEIERQAQEIADLKELVGEFEKIGNSILECPYVLDDASIPKEGIDANPQQVVGNMSVSIVKIRSLRALIQKAQEVVK